MLPIVDPTELIPVEFDFTDLLKDYAGATIGLIRITIDLLSGTDASPITRLYGTAIASALVVKQFFQPNAAQTSATKYRITCNIDVAGTDYKPTIVIELTVDKRTDA